MQIRRITALLGLTALVAGCHKAPPKEVTLAAAFRTIPFPPDAQPLIKEGGTEAMQMVIITSWKPDSVMAFYRRVLSADPFHLVNEQVSGKSTALYAEQENGPPIWVTIGPNGNEGSQVVLAGARDSDKRDSVSKAPKTADSGVAPTLPVKKP